MYIFVYQFYLCPVTETFILHSSFLFCKTLYNLTKQTLWGTDPVQRDLEMKHTSMSDLTELTLVQVDEDVTQQLQQPQKGWSLIAAVNVTSALHQFTVEMQRLRSRCHGTNRPRPDGAAELDPSKKLRSESKYSPNDSKSAVSSSNPALNVGSDGVEPDKRDDSQDHLYWNKYALV